MVIILRMVVSLLLYLTNKNKEKEEFKISISFDTIEAKVL